MILGWIKAACIWGNFTNWTTFLNPIFVFIQRGIFSIYKEQAQMFKNQTLKEPEVNYLGSVWFQMYGTENINLYKHIILLIENVYIHFPDCRVIFKCSCCWYYSFVTSSFNIFCWSLKYGALWGSLFPETYRWPILFLLCCYWFHKYVLKIHIEMVTEISCYDTVYCCLIPK